MKFTNFLWVLLFGILFNSCEKNSPVEPEPDPEPIYNTASDYVEIGNFYNYSNKHLIIKFLAEEYSMNILNFSNVKTYSQDFSFEGGSGNYSYADSFGKPVKIRVNYKFNKSGNEYDFNFYPLGIDYTTSAGIVFSSYTVELEFKIKGITITEKKQYFF